MPKNLIRSFLIVVLILWGVIFFTLKWLKADEPLSKDANELLAMVQFYDPNLKQDPYFYMLGFDARKDIDPQVLGREKYQFGWNEFYKNKISWNGERTKDPIFIKIQESTGVFLKPKDEELLKELNRDDSLQQTYQGILKHRSDLQRIYQQQTLLNQRYQKYLMLKPSDRILLTSISGATPNYILIAHAHYLYILHLTLNGNIHALTQYTEQLILKNQHASSLIHKMFIHKMISQNISILNEFNRSQLKKIKKISQLTPKQMSIRTAMADEFGGSVAQFNQIGGVEYNLFEKLDENGKFKEQTGLASYVYKKVKPYLYLPQMTENRYANYMMPAILLSEKSDPKFKKSLMHLNQNVENSWSVKNFFGKKLADIANPNWTFYAVRLRLLNQKIHVLNVLVQNRKIDLKQLNKNQQGFEYYEKNGELCFKSPDPEGTEANEKRYRSCLKI